jgi:hypothetical protein
MKKTLLFLALLIFSFGYCQNVFQDNFNNYTVNSPLSGQGTWTNNSSNGGSGACAGAICSNASVLTPGFSYLNYGSSTKSLQLLPDTDGCGTLFNSVSTGDLYVGFMINASSSYTSPNAFFRVNNGNAFTTSFRVYIKTISATNFTIGISKGSAGSTVYTTNSYSFNQDHLLIFKYSIVSGASDDQVNLYVNPVMANGVPTTPDASTTSGVDQTAAIDRLVFQQNTTSTPTGRAGLVSVAQSWTGLIFPNLSNIENSKIDFYINSTDANNGILAITSNTSIEKGILAIYNLEGKLIEQKNISLSQSNNSISINPIQNSGIYILSISGNGKQYKQKIVVKN